MTIQETDTLHDFGRIFPMENYPTLPTDEPRIRSATSQECDFVSRSSCRRGYRASWLIIDERLFLLDLRYKRVLTGWEPLFASWFTGVLRMPDGVELDRDDFERPAEYSLERQVVIVLGLVTQRTTLPNPRFTAKSAGPGRRNRDGAQ